MTYYSKDAGSIVGCAERQGASYGRIGYVERKHVRTAVPPMNIPSSRRRHCRCDRFPFIIPATRPRFRSAHTPCAFRGAIVTRLTPDAGGVHDRAQTSTAPVTLPPPVSMPPGDVQVVEGVQLQAIVVESLRSSRRRRCWSRAMAPS